MRIRSCLLLLALSATPALADGSSLPACDSPAVLDTIVGRQADAATWHDGVVIAGIGKTHQSVKGTRFVSAIEHRHCAAEASMSSGRKRVLHYVISDETGFAGYGWNVEFCLEGYDPYRVYDGACRVLR